MTFSRLCCYFYASGEIPAFNNRAFQKANKCCPSEINKFKKSQEF